MMMMMMMMMIMEMLMSMTITDYDNNEKKKKRLSMEKVHMNASLREAQLIIAMAKTPSAIMTTSNT